MAGSINIYRPACKIGKSATQNVANATTTNLTFNVTVFETISGMSDLANNRIVIPVDGVYLVIFNTRWAGEVTFLSTGSYRGTYMNKNGSLHSRTLYGPVNQASTHTRYGNKYVLSLEKGDNISLQVLQSSGETLAIQVANTDLAVVWLGRKDLVS